MSCWLVGLRQGATGATGRVLMAGSRLRALLLLAVAASMVTASMFAARIRAEDRTTTAAQPAAAAKENKNLATEKTETAKKETDKPAPAGKDAPVDQEALYKKFAESMTGVKLVGQFTVRGKENDKPARDEYTILSATKMENGDYWLIKARIQYGKNDLTIPMPLQVKWAGQTPVITLDQVSIPGLGTFSSRVVIDGTMYAGTWTHDKVGGHMFGTIEKLPPE